MKNSKRQIILGALILSLGAAVYLNWQFTDSVPQDNSNELDFINTNAQTDYDDSLEVGQNDENLGIAQLVNNSYVETVNDTIPQKSNDALADARLSRQQSRDEALEILSEILEDENSDADSKKSAVDKSAEIAQNMVKESNAENIIKSKGIQDVVVFINEGKCSVVVSDIADNMLLIQEAVINQTDVALENIQIIDAKTMNS